MESAFWQMHEWALMKTMKNDHNYPCLIGLELASVETVLSNASTSYIN
jgi:hypothetical protein